MTAASPPPPLDLPTWLARVGLDAPPPPDAGGLAAAHRAQLLAIPFENLDVVLGRGVELDPAAVRAKLLGGRRGGYCFECNQLLRDALRALGFDARLRLARVVYGRPSGAAVPPRTHAAVEVRLEGRRLLVDAGFGAPTPRHPLPLDRGDPPGTPADRPPADGHGEDRWHAVPAPGDGWLVRREPADGGEPEDLYLLDELPVHRSDVELANHWTSTHPASHFTRRAMVVRHLPRGRRTLVARTLTTPAADDPERLETRTLEDGAALRATLDAAMGIDPGADDAELDAVVALGTAWEREHAPDASAAPAAEHGR